LDSNAEQKSKPNQEPASDITTDLVKLAQRWQTASPEAKLLIIVDYFTQLQTIKPSEQNQLSGLYEEINKSIDSLIQFFQQDFNLLANAIVEWSLSQPNTKLLLVIDQFEELLTMTESDRGSIEQDNLSQADELQEWRKFLSLLQVVLGKNQQQLRVVVTLRSDFEPRFLSSALKDYWQAARFPIRAMSSDELRQAIEGPALKQALYFNPPELVSKLIDEVGQMPGALPLLSFTLSELYSSLYKRWREAQDTDRALQDADYQALGGVAGALTSRATKEYDDNLKEFGEVLGRAYQATMRRLMLRMVVIDGGGVARRRVPDAELIYSDPAETDRMVQVRERLVAARLLVKGQEADQGYVEPAHDFLVRGWGKLQDWIKEEQENIALQQRLTLAANDYAKDKGALWSTEGKRLDWLNKVITDTSNNWLNKLETDFVIASKKKRIDELQDIEERRKLAVSRQLAAQAELVRNQQVKLLQRSILLAVESIRLSPSFEANCALLSGLNLWPPCISKIDGQFDAVAFSPDEQYIALASIGVQERRQIQIYNIKRGEQVILIDEHSYVSEIPAKQAISFSPGEGKYLIAVTVSSSLKDLPSLQVWDTLTGKSIIDITSLDIKYDPYISKNSLFKKTALSSDGKLIASVFFVSGEQLIRVWEIATGLETDVISPEFQIDSISFNTGILYVATVDEVSTSRFVILNATTNQELIRIAGDKETRIVGFSPDGKYLATTYSSVIQIWDTFTGKQITRLFESNQSVLAIDFSPNGQYLSVLSGVRKNFDAMNNPYMLQVWEINSGIEIARLTHNNYSERSFACSYGKYLATRTMDGIQIWSMAKGDYKDVIASIPCQSFSTFAFSFDGEYLATTSRNQQHANEKIIKEVTKEIVIWRSTGSKIMTISQDVLGLDPKNISLSRDCEYLAVANKEKNGRIKVWRLTNQELLIDLPQEKSIKEIGFCLGGESPKIKIACTENTQEASNLWVLEEPGHKQLMHTSDKLSQIAFSLDGKYLAALGYDQVTKSYTIKIFDIFTGQNIKCIQLENFIRVDSIALDSDGSYVAITGVENIGEEQMCIWKVTGEPIMRIISQYHLGEVAISQKYLALRIQDYIHVYLWQPEDLINEACRRLNRNLTEKEWRQYFPDEPYRKICSNLP
jgi:WD40 repeat protein